MSANTYLKTMLKTLYNNMSNIRVSICSKHYDKEAVIRYINHDLSTIDNILRIIDDNTQYISDFYRNYLKSTLIDMQKEYKEILEINKMYNRAIRLGSDLSGILDEAYNSLINIILYHNTIMRYYEKHYENKITGSNCGDINVLTNSININIKGNNNTSLALNDLKDSLKHCNLNDKQLEEVLKVASTKDTCKDEVNGTQELVN